MPKRFRWCPNQKKVVEVEDRAELPRQVPLSDAMGFPEGSLAKFEAHRKSHGCSGVEFVRDKDVPQFYQVKCDSWRDRDKYMQKRRMWNDEKTHAGGITAAELRKAEELVRERHGTPV